MSYIRLNISLPEELLAEISRVIVPRKRSRFITEAIKHFLKVRRSLRLAKEYEEAAVEIKRINKELEGVTSDGID